MLQLILQRRNLTHYILWALTSVLYIPVFITLYRSRWSAADYTHAYFVLPIFLWLVWRKRSLFKELSPNLTFGGNILSLTIFSFGIFMYILGWRNEYIFITSLSIIPVIYGLIYYLYGSRIAKALFYPVLFLIFIIPLPAGVIDNITLPMRYGCSVAVHVCLQFFSYPVTREGLMLTIGEYDLFMGLPCSGFRSMITMFSLGFVYIYLIKGRLLKKTLLIASALPLSLFCNFIRVTILCLITYYFGHEIGQGFFHNFSGLFIFVLMILSLMGLESLLGKYLPNEKQ